MKSSAKEKELSKTNSFQELLDDTLRHHHNRLVDAAAVVRALIEVHKDMESEDRRATELNLIRARGDGVL
jgi:type I restriction enzyme R subunit